MYKNKTFVALIPARGGSEGIPKKNIALLNGKPLIRYTVEAAEKSKFLDAIYCTTDSYEIAKVASENSKCGIIKRPTELATNTSKTIDCVVHALKFLKEKGENFDYFVLLQPTSPLRTEREIDHCIEHVIENSLPSCVSVSPLNYLPVLMRYITQGTTGAMENVIEGSGTVRRQDTKKTYYVDGSIYIYTCQEIFDRGTEVSLNDAPYGFINDQLLDINTMDDMYLCEQILKKKKTE